MTDPLAQVVEQVWQRNRERVLARLARTEVALRDLAGGVPADAGAAQDAHVLAGALGTYGRPGSELLKLAELALSGRGEADPLALADEVRRLTEGL